MLIVGIDVCMCQIRTPQLAFTNGRVGSTSKHTLFMVPVKKKGLFSR